MTEPFGPDAGAQPPPPSGPTEPEFLQPKYLIALAVGAAIVLIAGIVVVATRGGDDAVSVDTGTTTATFAPLATTPAPLPSTSTSTTTSTTTSTSTSTVPPRPAVADAGADVVVDARADVALTARGLSEENQSVVWRQLGGPDVTDGAGRLLGAEVTFRAPNRPTTLRFEMAVTGRGGDVATDEIRIDVYEEADRAVFVDGADGSDNGDGSRGQPYRTLGRAIDATSGNSADIYLRTIEGASYAAGSAALSGGTSLYGGYDADWVRDVEAQAAVTGQDFGLLVSDSARTIVSSVDVFGPDRDESAYGLLVDGVGRMIFEHSTVVAGSSASGHSTGFAAEVVDELFIVDVTIRAAAAGSGANGIAASDGADGAASGNDASGVEAGRGGGNGGDGGRGGEGLEAGDDGEPSSLGGSGGDSGENAVPGRGSDGGLGGTGGDGGDGVERGGSFTPRGARGGAGGVGGRALGGGGGGGGGGLVVHDGGGGGGGGGGGAGGRGGGGADGGYGSVGLWLVDVDSVDIRDATIEGAVAGDGGGGGGGGRGDAGGRGGRGGEGVSSFIDTAGTGGGGGGGGAGGQGGRGGGGAGGLSVGLITTDVGEITVSGSSIRAGAGGNGGTGSSGGLRGAPGVPGSGRDGGDRGAGTTDATGPGAGGTPSSGGDAIGWWDDGRTVRTLADVTINGGTPGRPGGPGGRPGRGLDSTF